MRKKPSNQHFNPEGNDLATLIQSVKTVLSNRNVMAVTITQSLTMFAMFLWRPFWGLYILELGGTKSAIGLITTIQSLATLLVQLPGGIISDKLGRKRIILIASILGFLPPIIYRYSTHWTMLIPGAVVAASSTLAVPALNALIADSLPKENRATGFGAYSMAWYLAIVVSIPLGGYILDQLGVVTGTQWGLLISIILTIPVVLIRWKYIEETVKVEPSNAHNVSSRFSLAQLKSAPREIWKLIIVAVLSSFSFQVFWSYVVVYSVEEIGLSMMEWSIVSTLANFAAACFMIPSGFLSDRIGRKRIIILSQLGVSLSSLGYVVSSGYSGVAATRVLGSIGEGLGGNVMGSVGGPVWQALVTEVSPMGSRGSILGLMGTITGLITSPAPILGGYLYEAFSPQTPFKVSFILGIIGCVIFMLWVKEPEKDELPET
jgi:MFS family permease